MSDSVWSQPSHVVDAETARRSVFAQHVHIRGLLRRGQETASATLAGVPNRPDAVASAIGDIRTAIEVHLSFEERLLVPFLEADLPIGPERAHRMLSEHERQRSVLASLHREAMLFPELPTLSIKLAFLTSWLLADMEEEERELLIPEVIRDDQITIDQTSG